MAERVLGVGSLPLHGVCILAPGLSVPVPAEPTPLKPWQRMNCRGGLSQTGCFATKKPSGWKRSFSRPCHDGKAFPCRQGPEVQCCPIASHPRRQAGRYPVSAKRKGAVRAPLRRRGRAPGAGPAAGAAGCTPGREPCPAPGLPARCPARVRRRQGAALRLSSPVFPLLFPI